MKQNKLILRLVVCYHICYLTIFKSCWNKMSENRRFVFNVMKTLKLRIYPVCGTFTGDWWIISEKIRVFHTWLKKWFIWDRISRTIISHDLPKSWVSTICVADQPEAAKALPKAPDKRSTITPDEFFRGLVDNTSWYLEFENSFRPRQNGRHFTEGIFTCISMNEKLCTWIKISLTCVPKSVIDNTRGGGRYELFCG